MIRVLLLAIAITLVFMAFGNYKRQTPEQKRKSLWRLGIGAFLGLLIFLVVTGRMHWLGALLGALLPFIQVGIRYLSVQLPRWLNHKVEEIHNQHRPNPTSLQEALDTLGLKGNLYKGEINADMVTDAHRRLIQKLHPDRGGNDYLASKINEARDKLLAALGKGH